MRLYMVYGSCIGICLGTTYSCVGISNNGKIEMIKNEDKHAITHSCVAFPKNSKSNVVGDAAKGYQIFEPLNTVNNVKKLIGRDYFDSSVQEDMKHLGYRIIEDNGRIKIKIRSKDAELLLTPEKILSMILLKLKSMVKTKTGKHISKAVITVPNHFNNSQRQATINAAKIAKINVLNLLKEPSAAALAYSANKKYCEANKTILVYDLGGGTFDVSIARIEGRRTEILSVSGDTHLGGENFNQKMVDWLVSKIYFQTGVRITSDSIDFKRLHISFERAKRELSHHTSSTIDMVSLGPCKDRECVIEILRSDFERICKNLFDTTLVHVDKVLDIKSMSKSDISAVVLVGGSTRIPKIREMLKDHFGSSKVDVSMDPDTCVGFGASIQATLSDMGPVKLTGGATNCYEDVVLIDVVALSIGIDVIGGMTSKIISKNSPLPAKSTGEFTATRDYQRSALIEIYEGERVETTNNHFLGSFLFKSIYPDLRGASFFDCVCTLDENNMLEVECIDYKTNSRKKIKIKIDYNQCQLSYGEVDEMISKADLFKEEDTNALIRINEMVALDECVYSISRYFRNNDAVLNNSLRAIKDLSCTTQLWLERNKHAKAKEYTDKRKESELLTRLSKLDINPKKSSQKHTENSRSEESLSDDEEEGWFL